MTYSNALTHAAQGQGRGSSQTRALGMGFALGLALACLAASMAAWGQDDPLQQRRQELRSTVRQQRGDGLATVTYNKPANSSAATNAAGPVNQRHLTAEERTELRRQLARDLRAQRGPATTPQ
jgi:hypothetical protein